MGLSSVVVEVIAQDFDLERLDVGGEDVRTRRNRVEFELEGKRMREVRVTSQLVESPCGVERVGVMNRNAKESLLRGSMSVELNLEKCFFDGKSSARLSPRGYKGSKLHGT